MSARVITFHYVLTDSTGAQLDSSRERSDPMAFLEGSGQIIPGLEKVLLGMKRGDKKTVVVNAAEAYGERDQNLVVKVGRDRFPGNSKIQAGDRFRASSEEHNGPVFTVIEVDEKEITVDGNHPLAGQDLTFDVEIMDSREATQEEMSHGHAHGGDGHHH